MTQLPTYPWFDQVPEHLKTRKQLSELGLRPGGPVKARVVWRRGERWADLYDVGEARPKREASPAQLAALEKAQEKRRACPGCKTVFPYVLSWWNIQHCPVCEEQGRQLDRQGAIETAAAWLADPKAVILDTETTDLDGYLVEIAVIDMQGAVLLDTLLNPQHPISEGAQRVHGITEAMVADAPTFAQIFEQLDALLVGRTVITYNAEFDRGVLRGEVFRLIHGQATQLQGEGEAIAFAGRAERAWAKRMRWACSMEEYARFYGDWSEYHGDYRWQPLHGGHRALGDARACLAVVQAMAATAPPGEEGKGDPV